MKKKTFIIYTLLSIPFIILNVLTIKNLIPWGDEVMFMDTPYNWITLGEWKTYAWYGSVDKEPFSTYLPLYQILSCGWMYVFGKSIIAVRSLNIFITLCIGYGIISIFNRLEIKLKPIQTIIFSILLWSTQEMMFMYRNGRVDLLGALCSIILFICAIDFIHNKKRASAMIIFVSALTISSALQAAVYVVFLLIFCFITLKDYRKSIFKIAKRVILGYIIGFILVSLFMMLHDKLLQFIYASLSYSATMRELSIKLLPYIGSILGLNVDEILNKISDDNNVSLFLRLKTCFNNINYIVYCVFCILVYLYQRNNHHNDKTTLIGLKFLFFSMIVPIVMTFAGRYAPYYEWMSLIPVIIALTILIQFDKPYYYLFPVIFSVFILIQGIEYTKPNKKSKYQNIETFIEKQKFYTKDKIAAPFSTFYEIKNKVNNCYFVEVYPTERIKEINYIITSDNELENKITNYLNDLKNTGKYNIIPLDSCQNPKLTLYKVNRISK